VHATFHDDFCYTDERPGLWSLCQCTLDHANARSRTLSLMLGIQELTTCDRYDNQPPPPWPLTPCVPCWHSHPISLVLTLARSCCRSLSLSLSLGYLCSPSRSFARARALARFRSLVYAVLSLVALTLLLLSHPLALSVALPRSRERCSHSLARAALSLAHARNALARACALRTRSRALRSRSLVLGALSLARSRVLCSCSLTRSRVLCSRSLTHAAFLLAHACCALARCPHSLTVALSHQIAL